MGRSKIGKHGLYKYICDGEIIYIGKSNSNVYGRISAHKNEAKFKPYISKGVQIYTCELPNSTETDILERALINQYKPVLNGTDNQEGFSSCITINEPSWSLFDEKLYADARTKNGKIRRKIEKPPFPKELLDVPYMAIEKYKKYRDEHDVAVICPNGRIKINGYAPASDLDLKYERSHYLTLQIDFYECRDIEYDPASIYERLKELCHKFLFENVNSGRRSTYSVASDKCDELTKDLLQSYVRADIPTMGRLECFIATSYDETHDGTIEFEVINKLILNLFCVFELAENKEFDYQKVLSLYLRMTPWKK